MTEFIQNHVEMVKLLLANFVCPAIVAAVMYLITRLLDNLAKRRRCRKLAKARVETYLSDVSAGIQLIKTLIEQPGSVRMPRESWEACKLSDELLLEIIVLKELVKDSLLQR